MWKFLILAGIVAVAWGASATAMAAIPPVRSCESLTGVTHVTSAAVTGSACDVHGVAGAAAKFELKLPLKSYTGRYLQYGCDGYCGFFPSPDLRPCPGPRGG